MLFLSPLWTFTHNKYDEQSIYYFASVIALVIVTIYSKVHFDRKKLVAVPIYGQNELDKDAPKRRWMTDSINLMQEGYNKFRGRPFQVWTPDGYQVILPPKLVEETKMLQDSVFASSLPDILQTKHTSFCGDDRSNFLGNTLKHSLNKSIPKLFSGMHEELRVGLSAELPACHDWTPIAMYGKVTRIISRMSGRSFVGPTLARDEEWIALNVTYTRDAFQAASKIREWRPILRPLAKYFIPEIARIWENHAKATKILEPILKEKAISEKQEYYEKPIDALQWFREALAGGKKDDFRFTTILTLALGAASIHTTSQMVTNIIFDLAARPEYIQILREELTGTLNASDGKWCQELLNKLQKMDSFMKESQRFTAVVTSYTRMAVKDMTLSDGTYIPKGTLLLAPSLAISADNEVYSNTDTFDGLRYYKMRKDSAVNENRFQFTSTSGTMLHFGTGRHACPGRWFASAQIKLIIATVLLEYDFKFKDGQVRPKSILYQAQQMPNPMIEVLFKKRNV